MTQPSIILIESRQPNNPIGTGFVIHHTADHTYILTCAHVVRDMGGKDQVNAATLPAEVIAIGEDNGLDLAVLRVAQLTERPPLRLCAGGNPGQAVQIEGYYKYVSFRALEAITGRLAKSFTLSDTGHTHYEPAWYVTIDDHEKLLGGYSGSPVCDSGTGAVLGVMITSDGEQQGRAISINALTRIWPEMPAGLLGVEHDTVLLPIERDAPVARLSAPASLPLNQLDRAAFRRMLIASFNDSELRDLCFDLSIEYENLPGQSKSDTAREVVAYAERSGRSKDLLSACRTLRPNMSWDDLIPPSTAKKT